MRPILSTIAAIAITGAAAGDAFAHVSLATQQAPAGSAYKAVLQVGHACEGAATTAIRVKIPKGVIAVKPIPKSGWELVTQERDYARSYEYRGEMLTDGVARIAWTGGHLLDGEHGEFVFRARLPDAPAGTVVHFPVVQECVEGVRRWIAIPAEGKSAHDYDEPAPGVTLMARPD